MDTFETIIERGCGLDVHKATVYAHISGKGIKKQSLCFTTMTHDLINLKEILRSEGVTHVAMESTGVYWKPIYNILEEDFTVLLVNARHIKTVPGRKTDIKDCEWICKLLMSGLLKASFVPEMIMRDLRDLSRYKKKLIRTVSAEKNRVEKILEDCNIKISSVATDIFGISGTLIIEELLKGTTDIEKLSDLSKGRLRKKKEALKEALCGVIRPHHKFMIKTIKDHIDSLEKLIKQVDEQMDQLVGPYQDDIERLTTIPGVGREAARQIISEIGTDMSYFPNDQHLASWAGVGPGNNESAGKKKAAGPLREINTSYRY